MKSLKVVFAAVAVMMVSGSVFAAKPTDVGAHKEAAAAARLCRSQIVEQIKALPKDSSRKDAIKPLMEQLKACRTN